MKNQKDGVYTRPSAAIERGSGFFIPGLEGPKVRLVGGVVLLGLVVAVASSGGSEASSAGNVFAQGLAALFSLLVLFQAAVEFQKESSGNIVQASRGSGSGSNSGAASTVVWQKRWSMASPQLEWRDKVEWAASSYLALTPATDMLLMGPGKVLFSLGSTSVSAETEESEACLAALETLSTSKGGRVALPMTHPVGEYLQQQSGKNPSSIRCVVLQRVSEESQLCWAVASDQLLAGFTKQDLKWLGRLGQYVVPE